MLLIGGVFLLLVYSISIQSRFLDSEAVTYLGNYLCQKPFWVKIFDIQANEGGIFRAREPGYMLDIFDAYLIKLLVSKGYYFFHSNLFVIVVLAIILFQYCLAKKELAISYYQNSLLILIYLSSPVVMLASLYFRSAKIMTSLCLFILAWLFVLAEKKTVSRFYFCIFFCFSTALPFFDEQGLFFLLCLICLGIVFWRTRINPIWKRLTFMMIGSFGVYLFYRKIIGPELILKVGGRVLDPKTQAKYAIGFSQMFVDKAPRYTFTAGFELLVDWITYYFGSFLLPAIISMGGVFVAFWPVKKEEKFFSRIFLSKNPVFCTLLFSLSALLFMNCLMVKNHPGIYKALTAKLSYYGLPTMGLVLFASSWVVDRLNKKFTANKPLINLFLFLILILNIFSMDRHSEDFINTYNTYPGPSVETRYRNLVNCISSRGVNIPSSMDGNNQRLCKALLSIDGGECL